MLPFNILPNSTKTPGVVFVSEAQRELLILGVGHPNDLYVEELISDNVTKYQLSLLQNRGLGNISKLLVLIIGKLVGVCKLSDRVLENTG